MSYGKIWITLLLIVNILGIMLNLFSIAPPGTSDEHISIVQYLKKCQNLEGAVIVTTP
jgi:hypothetical protein